MEGHVTTPGPPSQVTLEFNPATQQLSFVSGDSTVFAFIEQRLGAHPIDKPAALAEEIVDAKQNAGYDLYEGGVSLRDIAVSVSYGVLNKDIAGQAARRLLERAGLIDAVAEATS